jgi:deoxyguanosine kinase
MFFLLSRYYQQRRGVKEHMEAGRSLISDYTFEKDALFARVNLAGDELEMYNRIHEALGEKTVHPDLIIYLRTDAEVLMHRIAMRDRPYERSMERGYIEQLVQSYDQFFIEDTHHPWPVLVIECGQLDYVRNPEDLRFIEDRINQELHLSPYQAVLPMEE